MIRIDYFIQSQIFFIFLAKLFLDRRCIKKNINHVLRKTGISTNIRHFPVYHRYGFTCIILKMYH